MKILPMFFRQINVLMQIDLTEKICMAAAVEFSFFHNDKGNFWQKFRQIIFFIDIKVHSLLKLE